MGFRNYSPSNSIELPSSETLQQGPPNFSSPRPSAPPMNLSRQGTPSRLSSSKFPRGRHLHGDHIVYDIDTRLPGEAQPQLEVSPITVYTSDPQLVNGRQIAVNSNYICYGLRMGAIRILNINTALRALLKGHTQRITDMAFFANDVHLLASASSDGRIFVRKIEEGIGEDGKTQIREQIILAIHFLGDWDITHPYVCWHSQNQDVLFVGINNCVLKIDITKARSLVADGIFSAEHPLKCSMETLAEGISYVGKHAGTVTSLSAYHWHASYLASASEDGTVRIWEGGHATPIATLKPHGGDPVGAVVFITSPCSPDNVILLTAGLLNHELKLWVCASPEGHLSSSSATTWSCIQTLEFISSSEPRVEDAFFNQIMVVPCANVILLANAKRNAIYAIHMDRSMKPSGTHMDYLAEFSVTTPILSFTATNESVSDGEGTIQIYCVQTRAIQQYALEMSQCFPPPTDFRASEESISHAFERSALSAFTPVEPSSSSGALSPHMPDCVQTTPNVRISTFSAPVDDLYTCKRPDDPIDSAPSSSEVPVPLSPRLKMPTNKGPSENFQDQSPGTSDKVPSDKHKDCQMENVSGNRFNGSLDEPEIQNMTKTEKDVLSHTNDEANEQHNISVTINPNIGIQSGLSSGPSCLVKPSKVVSNVGISSECQNLDKRINTLKKFDGGTNKTVNGNLTNCSQEPKNGAKQVEDSSSVHADENSCISQVSNLNCNFPNQVDSLTSASKGIDNVQAGGDIEVLEDKDLFPKVGSEESQENVKIVSSKTVAQTSNTSTSHSSSGTKKKKNKKNISALPPSTSPSSTPFPSIGSSDGEPTSTSGLPLEDSLVAQISSMRETLNQLSNMQELQKQMIMSISVPVTKEGKKIEAVLGQRMEATFRAQVDALWAKMQEENAKHERSERQLTTTLNNAINKELPATLERLVKKEIGNLVPSVGRIVSQSLEKTITSAVNDALQKGINDKIVPMLEKIFVTKIDSMVARHIQSQFQSTVKQSLQDALRTCFEGSVVPAFDYSCRAMFEQVDSAFRKGMTEHLNSAQQQLSASNAQLAATLKESVASASSLAQSLKSELADGQRKLLALAESAHSGSCVGVLSTKRNSGGLGSLPEKAISLGDLEESLDPTKELSRLVSEGKFEEAFNKALQRSDLSIVSWLCTQVDFGSLFSKVPLPLSQGVLLALVQQLSCELEKDTGNKLSWITEASNVLDPHDPLLAHYMRQILAEVYQNLLRLRLPGSSGTEVKSLRLALHVVNSLLTACKS
eukprot:TRINITY_DN5321_c0_g1_i1.p1 TRINITY_DN5321_c0_g1~~TRINITY_DN5321_c0_g1_i1.p1  ORF type:complete len:1265 (-),score=309.02 TRINITY_DN5321_c0_g1_i1:127-3921(-)